MPISVVMPALEMAQETGKLVAWRKKEGAAVTKGEILLEIETDKAVMEIESPGDGILTGVSVQEGAEVPVGQTIAWLLKPGEQIPTQTAPAESGRHTSSGPSRPATTPADSQPSSTSAAAKISPKARRLAQEHGIDVTRLRGSGPEGAVVVEDVLAVVQSEKSAPAKPATSAEAPALSTVARLMAERTTQSWTHVPHFFLVQDADATALIETRKKLGSGIEQARGVRPTLTDFLVTYVARTLTKHPRLNSSWVDGGIRRNSAAVNIAIAIAVEDGVVSGVIRDAANLGLGQIAVQRNDLSERAQAGRLRPSDISDATFTISNLGMYGIDAFSAIITPPQAAILAVGRIADRVVAINGKPDVRPMMTLTLSSDHRVVDGAKAAAFLKDLAAEIEKHPQDEP